MPTLTQQQQPTQEKATVNPQATTLHKKRRPLTNSNKFLTSEDLKEKYPSSIVQQQHYVRAMQLLTQQ